MDAICKVSSPIGSLLLAGNNAALTGLWLEGQKYFAATLTGQEQYRNLPIFDSARCWLDDYFKGNQPNCLPALAPSGSCFRQEVWKLLMEIPYGKTVTYGELAASLREKGLAASPRSVGSAVGHNPISIVIPCHRVIGANGNLTGYAGGITAKQQLLKLEGIDIATLRQTKARKKA